jgi:hypothetical protein
MDQPVMLTATSVTLRMVIAQAKMEGARLRYLGELAQSLPPPIKDRKRHSTYTKVLLAAQSFKVLTVIWKESEFVSAHEMISCGISKSFEEGDLTQLGLAKQLASSGGGDSTSFYNIVRNVSMAGEWFGLVTRTEKAPNKVLLGATTKLHDVMTRIAVECKTINAEFLGVQLEGERARE